MSPTHGSFYDGSRARGDAEPDSDWDLLVLLDGSADARRKDAVRDRLLDLGLGVGTLLSAIVFSADEWSIAGTASPNTPTCGACSTSTSARLVF